MAGKLFKLSQFHNDCYCVRGKRSPFIVKYDASVAGTGVGMSNTYMLCPKCKHRRHFRVDTWWGGSFKDTDHIYLDTAKKKKFNVADAIDMTQSLLSEHVKTLDAKVLDKKGQLNQAEKVLRDARAVLNRINKENAPAKKGKVLKKNG